MNARKGMVVLAAVLVWVMLAAPAGAITNGEADDGQHPYVGVALFSSDLQVPPMRCSGALISPTVFVTAAHCIRLDSFQASSALVTFEEGPVSLGLLLAEGIPGTPVAHPDWPGRLVLPATHDVGVVLLDAPVLLPGLRYAQLPELRHLDPLATQRGLQELTFTVVGYGLEEVVPFFNDPVSRLKATSQLVNLSGALADGHNIQTSNNPGNGANSGQNSGGVCFGDSGGPVMHGGYDSDLLIGVISFGLNNLCKGTNFAYRADIADTQVFLASFPASFPAP